MVWVAQVAETDNPHSDLTGSAVQGTHTHSLSCSGRVPLQEGAGTIDLSRSCPMNMPEESLPPRLLLSCLSWLCVTAECDMPLSQYSSAHHSGRSVHHGLRTCLFEVLSASHQLQRCLMHHNALQLIKPSISRCIDGKSLLR